MTNAPDSTPQVDAETLARVSELEILARGLVDGLLRGLHVSSARGSSSEFAEHRPYSPGDEIRRIDWRHYARSDRFFVKEYDDERNVSATLAIDTSRSMDFGSSDGSKLDHARRLAAAFGYLLLRQHDAVGVATLGAGLRDFLPPDATARGFSTVLTSIAAAEPSGATNLEASLRSLSERVRVRSMVLLFSDLLDDAHRILEGLGCLAARHVELIVFHLLDPAERDLPLDGWSVLHDPESGRELRIDPREMRETYRLGVDRHLAALRQGCDASGIDYTVVSTDEPPELVFARYVGTRARTR